jgi:hypothetical protein
LRSKTGLPRALTQVVKFEFQLNLIIANALTGDGGNEIPSLLFGFSQPANLGNADSLNV